MLRADEDGRILFLIFSNVNKVEKPHKCGQKLLTLFNQSFVQFLSYEYMKNCYFHGQYKASGLGSNKMLHFLFTSRQQCSCTFSEEKQKIHIFI